MRRRTRVFQLDEGARRPHRQVRSTPSRSQWITAYNALRFLLGPTARTLGPRLVRQTAATYGQMPAADPSSWGALRRPGHGLGSYIGIDDSRVILYSLARMQRQQRRRLGAKPLLVPISLYPETLALLNEIARASGDSRARVVRRLVEAEATRVRARGIERAPVWIFPGYQATGGSSIDPGKATSASLTPTVPVFFRSRRLAAMCSWVKDLSNSAGRLKQWRSR